MMRKLAALILGSLVPFTAWAMPDSFAMNWNAESYQCSVELVRRKNAPANNFQVLVTLYANDSVQGRKRVPGEVFNITEPVEQSLVVGPANGPSVATVSVVLPGLTTRRDPGRVRIRSSVDPRVDYVEEVAAAELRTRARRIEIADQRLPGQFPDDLRRVTESLRETFKAMFGLKGVALRDQLRAKEEDHQRFGERKRPFGAEYPFKKQTLEEFLARARHPELVSFAREELRRLKSNLIGLPRTENYGSEASIYTRHHETGNYVEIVIEAHNVNKGMTFQIRYESTTGILMGSAEINSTEAETELLRQLFQ